MDYLFKVTVAWTLFLLLFEIFYKNNTRFTINRIYLLLSIAVGLLLPIIPLPSNTPAAITGIKKFYAATQVSYTETVVPLQQDINAVATPAINSGKQHWDLILVIEIMYIAGVFIFLMKCLLELFKINRLITRNPMQIIHGNRVITTGKIHSPYSFMGYIFLTSTAYFDPTELKYILLHEAAHNTRKHWLDLWLMQLAFILFWFHPLIWRYRYLLQLQHEYEADSMAAQKDSYSYGQFLIHQTLLSRVPSVTHSFHFSPIKNRIYMLTKKTSFRPDNWKYLLLAPVLLGSILMMANTSVNDPLKDNQRAFKGNIFTWREADTSLYNGQNEDAAFIPGSKKGKIRIVISMNDQKVYQNDSLQMKATYGNTDTAFASYIIKEFQSLRRNTRDSLTYLVDISLVIDKEGKIVYYDAEYDKGSRTMQQQILQNPFSLLDPEPDQFIDKIIGKSPLWKPATIDGKPVNSFVNIKLPGC